MTTTTLTFQYLNLCPLTRFRRSGCNLVTSATITRTNSDIEIHRLPWP